MHIATRSSDGMPAVLCTCNAQQCATTQSMIETNSQHMVGPCEQIVLHAACACLPASSQASVSLHWMPGIYWCQAYSSKEQQCANCAACCSKVSCTCCLRNRDSATWSNASAVECIAISLGEVLMKWDMSSSNRRRCMAAKRPGATLSNAMSCITSSGKPSRFMCRTGARLTGLTWKVLMKKKCMSTTPRTHTPIPAASMVTKPA